MKLFCLQENLKNALNIVEKATGQNPTLPILSNLFLEAENSQLKISATNLEIGIVTWIPSKTEEKGEVCIQ
ncbi:MAG: polymerase III subunit beta protein [Candidatus Moranbacteria bacterium GW2011_GWF2_37_7]|nr:MAG: polymerase III subunit beta protein [Candidatus Moranbacteria bacterium GW2011_GWF2_37_7]